MMWRRSSLRSLYEVLIAEINEVLAKGTAIDDVAAQLSEKSV